MAGSLRGSLAGGLSLGGESIAAQAAATTRDEPEKACTTCGEVLPATPEFFWRSSRIYRKDGLENRCKACCCETPSMQRRRAEPPEVRRQRVARSLRK